MPVTIPPITPPTTASIALASITDIVLDETSSSRALQEALDDFARLCSNISGINPDPSHNAWAEDIFLDNGTAINPQAAAFCIKDYQRSVIFMRALYAAMSTAQLRFNDTIHVLYAGCGPFATLLLPLLTKFKPGEFEFMLLDIHQRSIDSVQQLIAAFGFEAFAINTVQEDACHYQHPCPLQLIIVETMQKSLEQEPQFAITANLAPQLCPQGIFIPQRIEVKLCLAQLANEARTAKQQQEFDAEALVSAGKRLPLGNIFTLLPKRAATQLLGAQYNDTMSVLELDPIHIQIPVIENIASYDAVMFTRIQAFAQYRLEDYQAAISLPCKCHELAPLKGGESYRISYQLGNYPRLNFHRL